MTKLVNDILDPIKGPKVTEPEKVGTFAIRRDTITRLAKYGLTSVIAQCQCIVRPELIRTQHAFLGLKRGMLVDGKSDAATRVVIYTWKSEWDYEWNGDLSSGSVKRTKAPADKIFVVHISPIVSASDSIDSIEGYVDHWSWVDEATDLPGAPIDWRARYDQCLWTNPGIVIGAKLQ